MDDIDTIIAQRQAAMGSYSSGLSSTPSYIDNLSRDIARLDFKLDRIEAKLDKLLEDKE